MERKPTSLGSHVATRSYGFSLSLSLLRYFSRHFAGTTAAHAVRSSLRPTLRMAARSPWPGSGTGIERVLHARKLHRDLLLFPVFRFWIAAESDTPRVIRPLSPFTRYTVGCTMWTIQLFRKWRCYCVVRWTTIMGGKPRKHGRRGLAWFRGS